jgi:hypothetical protein
MIKLAAQFPALIQISSSMKEEAGLANPSGSPPH